MARQNTRLESEGAEFLVLGELLIRGIPTYKTYTNMAGYDLVATCPEKNTSARVSVKSRWMTKANGFIIKNFNCDFVVVVKLNRGATNGKAKVSLPAFFVFPVKMVQGFRRTEKWGKVSFNDVPDMAKHQDRWDLISSFLTSRKAPKSSQLWSNPAPQRSAASGAR